VISLKRLMESDIEERLQSAVGAYRSLLSTVAECNSQVCPAPGAELQASLLRLNEKLQSDGMSQKLPETAKDAERDLRRWSERTSGYLKEKAGEVKELMVLVARTAESMGEHDTRYAQRFGSLSSRLEKIADLEDITKMRASLCDSIQEMRSCVEQMSRDSNRSIQTLQQEIQAHRERADEAERAAAVDTLTGLANRRGLELAYELQAQKGGEFTLLVFDLNGFKKINDHLGHLAGDDLLRQFASALRPAVRASDVAARWGGDEFVVLLNCGAREAEDQLARLRARVLREYSIQASGALYKVNLSAAVGMAVWKKGEAMNETLARADQAMYRDKERQKKHGEGRGSAEFGGAASRR
jgi:diguanylate cyclase (GGDEF)-like protein